MYCPHCGLQVPKETRFCSRCGMPLSAIADLIALRGMEALPGTPSAGTSHGRGVRVGVKLMLLSLVLLPLCFAASFPADSPAPLLFPLTVLLVGLFWTIYSRVFGEEPISRNAGPPFDQPGPRVPALEGTPHFVEQASVQRPITAEMADQASVTDHTTQLLD